MNKEKDRDRAIDVQDSAAKHVNYRGKIEVESMHRYKLPMPGKVILYNQMYDWYDHSGRPERLKRGTGRVKPYSGDKLQLEYCTSANSKYVISFPIRDFLTGMFRYVYMKDEVFVGGSKGFTYEDMDINNPHVDLVGLFISGINKNYSIQSEDYGRL